jgi:hypothetical protein
VQVVPQSMPAGVLITVPVPEPEGVTVTWTDEEVKLAVTDWAPDVARVQVPAPVHEPLHPPKVKPAAGVAVNVTCVPAGKVWAQVAPQSMPAGVLVTVPVPEPDAVTVTWTGLGGGGGLELPPPQPESNKTENKATNPPQSVEKNRMGSPITHKLEPLDVEAAELVGCAFAVTGR